MKRFEHPDYDYWRHGIGAFAWRVWAPRHRDRCYDGTLHPAHPDAARVRNPPRCMLALIPAPRFARGFEQVCLHATHAAGRPWWFGELPGWNGTDAHVRTAAGPAAAVAAAEDAPTWFGAIDRTRGGCGGWKGRIEDGALVDD